jgi:hypothetical protein
LSVAYHINNSDSKTSKFIYRGENTCEEFINNWLNSLFTDARKIFESQNLYYNSLNIPQYILSKIDFNNNNKYNIFIKVIGFNSKKFYINIFLNYISDPKIHIRTIIGTGTQYKSLVLEHDDFQFKLQFLDLKSFLAEGDLDKYATKFAKIQEKQKGIFPYELLEENTFVEELNKQKPFKYENFHSSLKGKNISQEEYNNYLTLNKNYNRLEYLQWYNI